LSGFPLGLPSEKAGLSIRRAQRPGEFTGARPRATVWRCLAFAIVRRPAFTRNLPTLGL